MNFRFESSEKLTEKEITARESNCIHNKDKLGSLLEGSG